MEKLQRASSGQAQDAETAEQLSKLKEDLEYVRVSQVCLDLVIWDDGNTKVFENQKRKFKGPFWGTSGDNVLEVGLEMSVCGENF